MILVLSIRHDLILWFKVAANGGGGGTRTCIYRDTHVFVLFLLHECWIKHHIHIHEWISLAVSAPLCAPFDICVFPHCPWMYVCFVATLFLYRSTWNERHSCKQNNFTSSYISQASISSSIRRRQLRAMLINSPSNIKTKVLIKHHHHSVAWLKI